LYVTPFIPVEVHHRFGETSCLHLQGGSNQQENGMFDTSFLLVALLLLFLVGLN
jgi:hypothetical protein